MKHCSKCEGIVFAETEDWDRPLCYSHHQQWVIDGLYHRVWELVYEINDLKTVAIQLGEDMKEVASEDAFL